MSKINNFEDIAPYQDKDVVIVLDRLINEPAFLKLAQSINPAITHEMLQAQSKSIRTIRDFQKHFISPIVKSIIAKSVNNLTISGLENLNVGVANLFISNHRDILLDSTFLNYLLIQEGYDSTQMGIGDNLLLQPWIADFFKLNKSFIVKRGLPGREFLKFSKRLSRYISKTLSEDKESIWIAQREGRTKDGYDETQPGLLKMLSMAEKNDFRDTIRALNIVPVAISYEYEPCDKLKAKETYKREKNIFKKGPRSDLYSMLSGIRGEKGNVHIAIGKKLAPEFEHIDPDLGKNDFIKAVADLLDQKIYNLYKLWKTNYIAHDLLNNNTTYRSYYSESDKIKFEQYLTKICQTNENLRPYFLQIYAGPVDNCPV